MSVLESTLRMNLLDNVSKPARTVAQALKEAERNIQTIKKGMEGTGSTDRLARSLANLGAKERDVKNVANAWRDYAKSAGLAANSAEWTKKQAADVKNWENQTVASIRAVKRERAAYEKGMKEVRAAPHVGALGGAGGMGIMPLGGVAGAYMAGNALAGSIKSYAELELQMLRIGLTAGESASSVAAMTRTVQDIANKTAMPLGNVVGGLEALVASGRSLKESMAFLPSVAMTAQAAGAQTVDMAKSADAIATHLKVSSAEMQGAFDILVAGGKAGQFELKDMASYLPSMAPAAKALGMEGKAGLTQLVAMLQVIRKGSGSSEQAATSMNNIMQKMTSQETINKFKKMGVNLEEALAKGKKEGRNIIEVFEEATWKAVKGDLSQLTKVIEDSEFQRGMRAILSMRGEWQKLTQEITTSAPGAAFRDANEVLKSSAARIEKMTGAWKEFMTALGGKVAVPAIPILEAATKTLTQGVVAPESEREKAFKEGYEGQPGADPHSGAAWRARTMNTVRGIFNPHTYLPKKYQPDPKADRQRGADAAIEDKIRREKATLAEPARLEALIEAERVNARTGRGRFNRAAAQSRAEGLQPALDAARIKANEAQAAREADIRRLEMLRGRVPFPQFALGSLTPDKKPGRVGAGSQEWRHVGGYAPTDAPNDVVGGGANFGLYGGRYRGGGGVLTPNGLPVSGPVAPVRLPGAAEAAGGGSPYAPSLARVDTSQIDAVPGKAAAAEGALKGALEKGVTVAVDSSPLDAVIAKAEKAKAAIAGLNGAMSNLDVPSLGRTQRGNFSYGGNKGE